MAAELPPLPPLSFPARPNKTPATTSVEDAAPVRKQIAPRRVVLDQMTPNNLGQVKMLHASLFPVVYAEKFYQDALKVRNLNKIGMSSFGGETTMMVVLTCCGIGG